MKRHLTPHPSQKSKRFRSEIALNSEDQRKCNPNLPKYDSVNEEPHQSNGDFKAEPRAKVQCTKVLRCGKIQEQKSNSLELTQFDEISRGINKENVIAAAQGREKKTCLKVQTWNVDIFEVFGGSFGILSVLKGLITL